MYNAPLIKLKEDERLLLHAALDRNDDAALAYYRQWAALVDFDDLSGGSYGLVPLLYRRLKATGQAFDNSERVAGIYRYMLSKNHMLFYRALAALNELEKNGIAAVLLKGAAMVAVYYKDVGVRTMNDLDFLIQESELERALKILDGLGWRDKDRLFHKRITRQTHAMALYNKEGYSIDLHWSLNYECLQQGTDEGARLAVEAAELLGNPVKVLDPVYQLLHSSLHGFMWNNLSPIRWIADSYMILESRSAFLDWDLLVTESKKERISAIMLESLQLLSEEFGARVPSDVLERLADIPKDQLEIRLFRALTLEPGFVNLGMKWLTFQNRHYADLIGASPLTKYRRFIHYLMDYWRLDHGFEIPGYMIRRAVKKYKDRKKG